MFTWFHKIKSGFLSSSVIFGSVKLLSVGYDYFCVFRNDVRTEKKKRCNHHLEMKDLRMGFKIRWLHTWCLYVEVISAAGTSCQLGLGCVIHVLTLEEE